MPSDKPNPAKKKGKSQAWKIILGIVISLVFLGLALYNVDFAKLIQTFTHIQIKWLLFACCFIVGSYYFRSWLWQQLLRKHTPPHIWIFFRVITIGYFANSILPLKLGEVVRAWLLSKTEKIPASLAVATVVLERGIDLLVLLTYFVFMMFIIPFENWLKISGVILTSIGVAFFLVVILNYRFGGHVIDYIERPLSKLPGNTGQWLHKQIDKFLEGLKLIETPQQFFMAYIFSLLSWFSWIMVTYFCLMAAGLQLPFVASVFVIVVLNFGLMIPSSPGGLGVFEFMVILALAKFNIEKEVALGVGFVYHMLQYMFILIIGWFFAIQMNVSMFKMTHIAEDPDVATPEVPSKS